MNLSSARILSLILALMLSCLSLNLESSSSYLIVLNEIFKNPETLWPLTHYWALLVTGTGVSSLWLVWFTVFSHHPPKGERGERTGEERKNFPPFSVRLLHFFACVLYSHPAPVCVEPLGHG